MRKCLYAALVTLLLAGAVYAQDAAAQAARPARARSAP